MEKDEEIIYLNQNDHQRDDIFRYELEQLVSTKTISLKAIALLNNLDIEWLEKFIFGQQSLQELSIEQQGKLRSDVFMLREGVEFVSDDERLVSITTLLIEECGLSLKAIAMYSETSIDEIEQFLTNPTMMSHEVKYKIAVKVLFLYSMFRAELEQRALSEN